MKQIFKNRYIKSFRFASIKEAETFIHNQNIKNVITFNKTSGDYYYCYVCYNSLTTAKQFLLSFSCDEDEENLNFLFWEESKLFVLDTSKYLYLIDDNLKVKMSFDITTPLIGLYLTSGNNLLVLEETSFRLINSTGCILFNELFDLIEEFSIDNNQLLIRSSNENKIYNLI